VKTFSKVIKFLNDRRLIKKIIPINEHQYEKNPTKIRTAEVSQLQDDVLDITSKSPERDEYEDHAFEMSQKHGSDQAS
jgi:vacuolar-type H+-ATPase subunit F/Vma7